MKFVAKHPNFRLPTKSSVGAGGYDIYMPEHGAIYGNVPMKIGLGFAARVPDGHIALILPRSSSGSNGLELVNTCGVIDSDYTGEWIAKLRDKIGSGMEWNPGDRLLQLIIIPVLSVIPELVDSLEGTKRGDGGFGSTGT